MKITITQDFDTVEEAAVFLARVGNPAHVAGTLTAPPVPTPMQAQDAKTARKPRSDAGKPREPYGPRATNAEPQAGNGAGSVSASAATDGAEGGTSSPAASAPNSSAPAEPAQAPQAQSDSASAKATPAAEDQQFPRTEEGVRLAMQCLNKTKGAGTEACLAALKGHSVVRITDLPKDKYDVFIKYVLAKSSKEGIAEALKVGAPKKADKK